VITFLLLVAHELSKWRLHIEGILCHSVGGRRTPLQMCKESFFLWGYARDTVSVPPLPTDIRDVKHGSLKQLCQLLETQSAERFVGLQLSKQSL
jgi:hypothetical protein